MRFLEYVRQAIKCVLATLHRTVVLAGVLACGSLLAQPAVPTFEVASIKPHARGAGVHLPGCSGDRFDSAGVMFGNVLQWAYLFQGTAGYDFFESVRATPLNSNFYDIQAKAEHPFASEKQCRLMVQALFADRFKLSYHWELRDAEISDLVIAPGGAKLQKALATDEGTDVDMVIDGRPRRTAPPEPDGAQSRGMTMDQLAHLLMDPAVLNEIVNKTGLEGRYKIDLRYSTSLPADSPFGDPLLDAALPEQLGLRLQKHKGSLRVPILDHIEAPTPN